ncbi:hypothetical protein Nepgr_030689 [Nepenthes gracilis]|uniref:General transcription factor IIH subunit 2 n=1 Tax=Nepenthes gracilis TaxID=150966 RepID=A0AAD3Y6T9_NEPGR|nr:hypothetical protein Nepgr_030689 [Nepenthes gracilis]
MKGEGQKGEGQKEAVIIWDSGSPLYDSFELVSISHVIERHTMAPSSSLSLTAEIDTRSSCARSSAKMMEEVDEVDSSSKYIWKNLWRSKMKWGRIQKGFVPVCRHSPVSLHNLLKVSSQPASASTARNTRHGGAAPYPHRGSSSSDLFHPYRRPDVLSGTARRISWPMFCLNYCRCLVDFSGCHGFLWLFSMNNIEHREVSNSRGRRLDEEPEGDEDEDEENGRGMDAWERTYVDDRSWESLQEDESGLLRPIDNKSIYHAQYRRRLHSLSSAATTARIQKGLIRYLYVIVDFSRAAAEMDFRPSRMAVIAKHVEAFIREFFDQNPLSQIGLVIIKDGIAHCLTDLGGSPESHIKALMSKLECSGDASLQNALELVNVYLNQIPSYGYREVLIVYSALSTCDPGDIMETIQKCKQSKMRCSIVGLAAEMFICQHICQETGGLYSVALDESHLKELLLDHAPPPPAIAEYAIANLIKMGFPQRVADGVISICSCHKEAKMGGGYTCPRCKSRVCELPTECCICGLTLVSSPHLARSYHHLFPISPFDEVSPSHLNNRDKKSPKTCFGCQQSLLNTGNLSSYCVTCSKCRNYFCLDCDIYIHENLHNCPGCESSRQSNSVILI